MALISCENCGKQISDKAAACPHCGAARTPATELNPVQFPAPVQSPAPAPQQPKGNGKKVAIIVGAAVALLALIITVVVIATNHSGKPKGTIRDDSTGLAVGGQGGYDYYDEPVSTPEPVEYYDVTLDVKCKQNESFWGDLLGLDAVDNQYDVDILVGGEWIATLDHGTSNRYIRTLRPGTYEVEFRINGKTSVLGNDIYDPTDRRTFVTKTIRVMGNDTFFYDVELASGNSIQVTERS